MWVGSCVGVLDEFVDFSEDYLGTLGALSEQIRALI